jgi:hypothetical protein
LPGYNGTFVPETQVFRDAKKLTVLREWSQLGWIDLFSILVLPIIRTATRQA